MATKLKAALRNLAARAGYSLVPHGAPDEYLPAITSMHPVVTSTPLVRVGGEGDGGYLVPDDFVGIEALFSPGVSDCSRFERSVADRGIECYLADASVDGPAENNSRFHFAPKFLGIQERGKFTTLDRWVSETCPGHQDLMLQMDIEGAEWSVLANMSDELLRRFRIMVIELHQMHRLLDCQIRRDVLQRLLENHHIVHSHPNNWGPLVKKGGIEVPMLLEVTLYRKDRAGREGFASTFPHPLDNANVLANDDYPLPRCWYA